MGKIKTVIMGDLETEETARKKAEEKRAQKKIRKSEKPENSENQTAREPEESDKSETLEVRPSELSELSEKKSKKKAVESKYRFPAGKKYAEAKILVDPKKVYPPSEAIDLVKKTSISSFDGSVEVHFNVTDKNLRGMVVFPHGTGKQVKVAVADDSLITNLEKSGKIDFDILVASPEMMPKLAKVAKILGPKGLMPNPKTGTISDDTEALALRLRSGQLSWKTQPDFPIIHAVIGKVSFETKKLAENLAALTKSIGRDKIKSAFIKATMGPSIKVAIV